MKIFFSVLILLVTPTFASTILFVGDSQSAGPFGKKLDTLLRQDHQVMTRAVCGSVGDWWQTGHVSSCSKWNWGRNIDGTEVSAFSKTPILSTMVNQTTPDFVVLQFGGNYKSMNDQQVCEDVEKLISTAKKRGAKCMFVTGPDTFKDREFLPATIERLEAAAKDECYFFNSVAVTEYPDEAATEKGPNGRLRADGRHYSFVPEGEAAANQWAELVYASFVKFESENILSSH